jgi:hypothetical protein
MNKLSTKHKIILGVVVLAVVVYICYRIFAKKTDEEKILEESVLQLPVEQKNVTLSENDLKTLASQLHAAMDGLGTDEDTIFEAFNKIKTKDDLHALIRTFGIRDGEDPRMWLKGELDSDDQAMIRKIFEDLGATY